MGVTVNVTGLPEQNGLVDAMIDTPICKMGLTDIVTVLDIAGLPDGHKIFDVKNQITKSPLTGR